MKLTNIVNSLRNLLAVILGLFAVTSFICMIGCDYSPMYILIFSLGIHIISILLLIFLYYPTAYYRRFIPLSVCVAAMLYPILKPFIMSNKAIYNRFKRCYKIKKMSGSYENCYLDVQDMYDEYIENTRK